MLRVIPSSAIAYAIEGALIKASTLREAGDADRLAGFARTRSAEIVQNAEREAAAKREVALAQGYAEGYADALSELMHHVRSITSLESAIVDAALERVRRSVRDALADLDFDEAFIAQWCAVKASAPTEQIIIHVPEHKTALIQRLQSRVDLPAIDVRSGEQPCVTIECGHLVFEFDPECLLLEQVSDALDIATELGVGEELKRLATEFSQAFTRTLRAKQHSTRLAST